MSFLFKTLTSPLISFSRFLSHPFLLFVRRFLFGCGVCVSSGHHTAGLISPGNLSSIVPNNGSGYALSKARTFSIASGGEDRVVWKLSKYGIFSVSSLYATTRVQGGKVWWHRLIWAPSIMPKFNFISWLLLKGRLKTKCLLIRRGMAIDKVCLLCLTQDEDIDHLFFYCSFAKGVWQNVLAKFGFSRNPVRWSQEIQWLK